MILDRIKLYLDTKGIKIATFEKSIGMSNASFGKSLKNGGAIGTDKLENILNIYTDLSVDWLLTGNGEMLKSVPVSNSTDMLADRLLAMIEQKDKLITAQAQEIGQLKERLLKQQRIANSVTSEGTAHAG